MSVGKIRLLNDKLRKTFTGGKVMLTVGVCELNDNDRAELLNRVRTFDKFTANNDPNQEHDFGAIDFKGTTYFWKIDYYDNDYLYMSPDPTNEDLTNRVLTIMRGDEY